MFCKKILSFICVLFIGSQLSIVKAESTCAGFTVDGDDCEVNGCTADDDYGYYYVGEKIVEVTGVSSCSVEKTKGYYKMKYGGDYYSYNGSTYAAVTHSASNNNHGQIDETSGLNLDASGKKIAFEGEGSYLLTDINKIFSVSSGTEVSVKSVGDSIVLDTSFNGNDYCVDANKKIAERSDNWCSSNECTYYDCENGDCIAHGTTRTYCNPKGDPATEQVKCIENGYYLMDQSTREIKTTAEDSGDLYLCKKFDTATITCKKVGTNTDSDETGEAVPTGFLVNSGAGSGTGKYIKCNNGTCTAIGLVTEYGTSEPIDSCEHANVNDIILVDETYMFICLEKSSTGGLEIAYNDNNRQFFVDVGGRNTIFGTTTSNDFKYLLVDLNGGNAILHAKDNARYKYADASLEIFGRKSDNICNNGSLRNTASEFKKLEAGDETTDTLDANVDYYKKLSE